MPEFTTFQAACDWIDEHTTPETAGMFTLEQADNGSWTVSRYLSDAPIPDT